MSRTPSFEVAADGWKTHDFPGVGLYDWDIKNDRLIWSPELVRTYGLKSAPTAEDGFLDQIHPEDRLRVEAETAFYLGSVDAYEHEFRIVRPNGEVRHIHDRGVIERDEAGLPVRIRGINIDLTEIDVETECVRRRPLKSSADARTGAFGAYSFDPASRRSEWSRELRALLGADAVADPPTFADALAGVHPGDRERVRAEMDLVMRTVAPFELEYRVVRGDGTISWVQDRGHCSGPVDPETGLVRSVHGFLIDVTAHRLADARRGETEAHLRAVFEHIPAAIALVDNRTTILRASRRFLSDLGLRQSQVIGQHFRDVWPQAEEICRGLQQGALEGRSPTREEEIELPSGRREWIRWTTYPWSDGFNDVRGAFLVAEIVTEGVAAKRLLLESQERLADALRAGELGVHDFDPRTGNIIWDATVRSIWGVSAHEPVNYQTFISRIHPDDLEAVERQVAIALNPAGPGRYEAEYRVRSASDAEYRWVRADGVTYFDGDTPIRLVGTVADVTSRKIADEHHRYLMRELSHRSKNLIALVQAIARNIARSEPGDFLQSLDHRLAGLANSQNLLLNEDWRGVDLGELLRSQLVHFRDLLDDRIKISGDEVVVSSSAAQTLGMAFYELATNAAKYGALSTGTGRVEVNWTFTEAKDQEPVLSISWQESGGPRVEPPSRPGFGTAVLTRLVRTSLKGKAELLYEPSGLKWTAECGSGCLGIQARAAGA